MQGIGAECGVMLFRLTMRSLFHWIAYRVTQMAAKILFSCITRIHVFGEENADPRGGSLLAANHISHFDPPIIATVLRRKVDWMAMAEFFPHPVLGRILRAIECFPVDRHRAERATIRTAIDRLKRGRIVGMFPEGGIRDGKQSVLEGAPLRPGVSTLAHIAAVPILPCVILGSDRLYSKRRWRPWRRTPIWVGFSHPIYPSPASERSAARSATEAAVALAFTELYRKMRAAFSLQADDLPQPPCQRMRQ
jgi:1-acyl-sn-glycerol-3-phosphate acyltransferase